MLQILTHPKVISALCQGLATLWLLSWELKVFLLLIISDYCLHSEENTSGNLKKVSLALAIMFDPGMSWMFVMHADIKFFSKIYPYMYFELTGYWPIKMLHSPLYVDEWALGKISELSCRHLLSVLFSPPPPPTPSSSPSIIFFSSPEAIVCFSCLLGKEMTLAGCYQCVVYMNLEINSTCNFQSTPEMTSRFNNLAKSYPCAL